MDSIVFVFGAVKDHHGCVEAIPVIPRITKLIQFDRGRIRKTYAAMPLTKQLHITSSFM